jgi:hypothetical protein
MHHQERFPAMEARGASANAAHAQRLQARRGRNDIARNPRHRCRLQNTPAIAALLQSPELNLRLNDTDISQFLAGS